MRSVAILLLSAMLSAGAVAAPARDQAEKASDARDKMICKRFAETGSLVRGKRICKTKAEWEQDREQQRAQMQSGACGNMGNSGTC